MSTTLVMFITAGASLARAQSAGAAPSLTLAEARRIIEAAHKAAAAMNLRLSFAVVDGRGDLIALERMAGAGANTPDTAIGKAMLSAFFGSPSADVSKLANAPFMLGLNDATGGKLRFFQGALPIVRNGMVVGSAAASGATAQQDEDVIKAALGAGS